MPLLQFKIPAQYTQPISGFLLILHSIAAMMLILYVFMSGYKELWSWIFDFLFIGVPWAAAFLCFSQKKYVWTGLIALSFIAYASYSEFTVLTEKTTTTPIDCIEGSSLCHMYNHL